MNNISNIRMELTETNNEVQNIEPINTDIMLQNIMNSVKYNPLEYDRTLQQIQSYDMNYTVKELHIICDYYNKLKYVKACKFKKQALIEYIILFENDVKNEEIVKERMYVWDLMDDIKNNPFMKKFIIWQK